MRTLEALGARACKVAADVAATLAAITNHLGSTRIAYSLGKSFGASYIFVS
jgi:hypothetical protein